MIEPTQDKKAMALAQLQRSRSALQGITPQEDHTDTSQSPSVWGALTSAPGVSQVLDLAKAMWADSPWHLPAQVASQQWRGVMAPLVRKHPLASVAVAAVAGFAIIRHRHVLMQALMGMATSSIVEQWLHAPAQTGADPNS
jgi:hypothetical protein